MTSSSIAALLLTAALTLASSNLQLFEAVEPQMGTLVRIKLYARDSQQADAAFAAAFRRIAELDRIFSDYRPDSELNRLCGSAAAYPVPISDDLFRVLAASLDLAEQSGGAFDITQGPVIRLWRQARRDRMLPEPGTLRSAMARSGFRKLHLNADAHTAVLDQSNMQLDLGGIAKGYAADAALEVLERCGIPSALVAVSGDLAFSHAPPGRRGWRIALGSSNRIVELTDAAISTSGDAEQNLELNGKRYSHIVDPSTGEALTNGIEASVIARRGIIADSLATAICVLGAKSGIGLVERYPNAAAMVVDASNRVIAESPRIRDLAR